jgi:hypothetical protein
VSHTEDLNTFGKAAEKTVCEFLASDIVKWTGRLATDVRLLADLRLRVSAIAAVQVLGLSWLC